MTPPPPSAPHPLPADCSTADDVDALARALYRDAPFVERGVLHVTALWEPPGADGPLVTLAINAHAPKSDHDFFVLNLARARADALVCTGKMLRDEPHTRYDLQGPGRMPEALAHWRRRSGRTRPPTLVVLTTGRGFDPGHPALNGAPRPLVVTDGPGAERVRARLGDHRAIEIVTLAEPSIHAAIDWLRRDRGARLVSVEAGPSTSRALYETPVAIDELMLSTFRGDTLDDRAKGPSFLLRTELESALPASSPPSEVDEPSGPWRFELRRRW